MYFTQIGTFVWLGSTVKGGLRCFKPLQPPKKFYLHLKLRPSPPPKKVYISASKSAFFEKEQRDHKRKKKKVRVSALLRRASIYVLLPVIR